MCTCAHVAEHGRTARGRHGARPAEEIDWGTCHTSPACTQKYLHAPMRPAKAWHGVHRKAHLRLHSCQGSRLWGLRPCSLWSGGRASRAPCRTPSHPCGPCCCSGACLYCDSDCCCRCHCCCCTSACVCASCRESGSGSLICRGSLILTCPGEQTESQGARQQDDRPSPSTAVCQ